MAHPAAPIADRFWAKVDRWDPDHCWLWTGGRATTGYGTFMIRKNPIHTVAYAHRMAYTLVVGPIPPGLTIDHLCRVRACVNPKHMEPVTLAENISRATRYVCRHGHEFTPENTYVRPNGYRMCRVCIAFRQARRRKGPRPKQTHCLRGHPLSGENLAPRNREGGTRCRVCMVMHSRESKRRARAVPTVEEPRRDA